MHPACEPQGGLFRARHSVFRGECIACGRAVAEPTAVRTNAPARAPAPPIVGHWPALADAQRAPFDEVLPRGNE